MVRLTPNQLIYLKYTGIIDITADLGAILSGRPDSKSTDFGSACKNISISLLAGRVLTAFAVIHLSFETGSEKYRALETGVYVGAGRFVVGKERPLFVEYKVSRVVSGGDAQTTSEPGGTST
jgi:hypothetical protein